MGEAILPPIQWATSGKPLCSREKGFTVPEMESSYPVCVPIFSSPFQRTHATKSELHITGSKERRYSCEGLKTPLTSP